jgi:hypothetical protein
VTEPQPTEEQLLAAADAVVEQLLPNQHERLTIVALELDEVADMLREGQ